MRALSFLLLLTLAACSTSAPISIGKDTRMVSVTRCGLCESPLGAAMREASADCTRQGLNMLFVSSHDNEPVVGNHSATVTYRCLSTDDPRYKESTPRPDNGVSTVESK